MSILRPDVDDDASSLTALSGHVNPSIGQNLCARRSSREGGHEIHSTRYNRHRHLRNRRQGGKSQKIHRSFRKQPKRSRPPSSMQPCFRALVSRREFRSDSHGRGRGGESGGGTRYRGPLSRGCRQPLCVVGGRQADHRPCQSFRPKLFVEFGEPMWPEAVPYTACPKFNRADGVFDVHDPAGRLDLDPVADDVLDQPRVAQAET
jgi:hypothetical protein